MPGTDGPQPEPIGGLTSHRVLLGQLLDTWSMRLERNGIVERVVITTRPVAVEYRITPLGKTIRDPVDVLLGWVAEHLDAVEKARGTHDCRTEGTAGSDPRP